MTEKAFLSTREAAELLGVCTKTLYRRSTEKNCPVTRRGRLYYRADKLLDWWEHG